MTVISLHCLGGEGNKSWRWAGLLLRDLYHFCNRRVALSRGHRGGVAGSCGEGSCGTGGTRGRGGGSGRGLDRSGVINWGRESSGGCLGSSRLVVVHLEDVLLEVSDPVLLHRQRTMELHLAEPDAGTQNHQSWEVYGITLPGIKVFTHIAVTANVSTLASTLTSHHMHTMRYSHRNILFTC